MNSELTDLLAIGIPATGLGIAALALMIHQELGPFASLDRAGKWLLSAAFGMGLLAFGLKMAVAVAIEGNPGHLAAPHLPFPLLPQAATAAEGVEFANPAPPRSARHVWAALPEVAPAPADNPTTPARVALGRRLFFEKKLSGDGSLACASCHDLFASAGADGRPTAKGIAGQVGMRNTPTVWNAAFQSVLFWDGRAASLEEQAMGPILNPLEMGLASPAEAERRLNADAAYRAEFQAAFGDAAPISFVRIAQAIAAFERTLITPDSPYDRFVRGETGALTRAQLRGMALFETVGCVLCHRGPNFSDASLLGGENARRVFPANATPYETKYGLLVNGERAAWRVASLRNVALTGPWLHNGSVDSLPEVVRIMAGAQLGRSAGLTTWLDEKRVLGKVDRSPLGEREIADLVAFLEALSSDSLRARMSAEKSG
ncbi:cytochrome-c peroxidase [Quatrionicoccus australiensis]|uniref:cytochrome-c peroxidase n=1 Tax=Quatrionicoccus australiensis TaxID=138118 RepID=UPI001CF8DE2C|nr:cytochrome c peroxidase [Quatrionicoccus australiensis]UCV14798.1 hypothetical protein KI612_18055 [Quatrionicoccus australiensis]